MRQSNKRLSPKPLRFAFVVDGECEVWYLQMLKRNERKLGITLSPQIPQKTKLEDQYNKVIELSEDYDKVFWIIDLDVVNNETLLAEKGTQTPLQKLERYYNAIVKKNAKSKESSIIIIINNPCLEFWFLLHFESTAKYFTDCNKAIDRLKKHLPNFDKTQKYFTAQGNDIYLRLKPHLKSAIDNAKKLGDFDFQNPRAGMAQMQFFFELSGIDYENVKF
ncbi:RloB-like protein [Chitinophaga skermanii]|uniref:RloB-like protein n=1 Tax=Chitinophaga skermanii TaxID=331697 RepID=A0A327Q1F5_9BACT|nr:RloB family protein [Chitinophaga skermanii]RAI97853.1 RloB-like protein [Chitinophaga skermanii]